jgi:hypothetical protein
MTSIPELYELYAKDMDLLKAQPHHALVTFDLWFCNKYGRQTDLPSELVLQFTRSATGNADNVIGTGHRKTSRVMKRHKSELHPEVHGSSLLSDA